MGTTQDFFEMINFVGARSVVLAEAIAERLEKNASEGVVATNGQVVAEVHQLAIGAAVSRTREGLAVADLVVNADLVQAMKNSPVGPRGFVERRRAELDGFRQAIADGQNLEQLEAIFLAWLRGAEVRMNQSP